jgi:dsRNA-specific ribonuclease
VKLFSDAFESTVAAVFLDSGNFDMMQLITLRLMHSEFVKTIPLVEHPRTKVQNVWNSKTYTKGIKIYHIE